MKDNDDLPRNIRELFLECDCGGVAISQIRVYSPEIFDYGKSVIKFPSNYTQSMCVRCADNVIELVISYFDKIVQARTSIVEKENSFRSNAREDTRNEIKKLMLEKKGGRVIEVGDTDEEEVNE